MADDTSAPAAAPVAPAAPVMSVAEGLSRKAEFFAEPAKMAALMRDDISAKEEWRAIVAAVSAQPAVPIEPRQKAALAEQERTARQWSKVQAEEIEKLQTDRSWKELGWMNSQQGRDFVRRNCGFDPGW